MTRKKQLKDHSKGIRKQNGKAQSVIIKRIPSHPNTYLLEIDKDYYLTKTAEIHKQLRQAGYLITQRYDRKKPANSRMVGHRRNVVGRQAFGVNRRQLVVLKIVVAPNDPVDVPPFPDPNGNEKQNEEKGS